MRYRMAVAAGAIALSGGYLAACGGGVHAAGPSGVRSGLTSAQAAGGPSEIAPTGSPASTPPGTASSPQHPSTAATGGQDTSQTTTPAISDAELSQFDQQLSDAGNALGAADQAMAHNETGDATP